MRRVVLLILVAALFAAPARADEDLKALWNRGAAYYALHKFAEAATLWEQVLARHPDAAVLYNVAQAQRLAGNKARALELYQTLLGDYGTRLNNRGEIERRVRELDEAIGKQKQEEAAERARQQQEQQRLQVQPRAELTTLKQAPANEPVDHPSARPVWRRGWFWGATVAGVVVVAGAITAGVVLGRPSPRQLPDFRF
jgi:tetratricopeptide (TPR) repeat protein